MEKNLDITKPRYSEHILPVPWPFVISRFHCTKCLLNTLVTFFVVKMILSEIIIPHEVCSQSYIFVFNMKFKAYLLELKT